jgi:hypothetical protein
MAALAMAVNDGNKYSGKYFLLTQSLTGISTRIGNLQTNCFSGIFDGGGYALDVNISVTGSDNAYAGIFGYISGATIKNLGVVGSVSSSSSSDSYSYSYSYSGGICGYATSSTINNCYNTGNVSSSSSSSHSSSYYSSSGGICGYANKITSCFATNMSISSESRSPETGRISGNSDCVVEICYALSSMLINGYTVNSQSLTSQHGKDEGLSSFQSQIWIEDNLFWDFANTWYIPDGSNVLPVLKKNTKINFSLSSNNITYGDIQQITLAATSNNAITPIVYVSSNSDIAEVTGTTLNIKKAGTVSITASQNDGNGYKSGSTNVNLVINKKQLTITADSITMTYGDTPEYTCRYDGFVSGETQNDLIKLPKFTCTATSTSNVGNYTITPSGAESDNYSFTYKTGALTIQKRTLRVIPDNVSRIYGNSNTFTFSYEGFVNGNTASNISIKPTGYSNATQYSFPGDYEITCSGGSATNYDFTYGTGTLTITKAPLTIKANNVYRYYGDDNPTFSVYYSGFKNSETETVLSSQPQVFCSATKYSDAGTYPIVISENITAANYDISYTSGTLQIYKTTLYVRAKDTTRYAGEANPEFTIIYSGFVNGENESVLDVLPQATCSANAESNSGTYTIYVSGGSDNNYEIYRQYGMLTILQSSDLEDIVSRSLSLSPNPAKNHLYIQSDYPVEKVELYNSSGICVLVENNINGKIDVSALAKGFYVARIYVRGISLVQRFIIGN